MTDDMMNLRALVEKAPDAAVPKQEQQDEKAPQITYRITVRPRG